MNVAIVIAGGIGSRMHAEIPKQFILVNDKPIIIYTLEAFQRHPEIDAIEVVCIDGWHDYLQEQANKFHISKLRWITSGGTNGQGSARNGLLRLEAFLKAEDIVIIHDAIRPIIPQIILTDMLDVCRKHGNACASLPCHETLIRTEDQRCGSESIDRATVRRVQTPQAYHFGELLSVHKQAIEKGITHSVYANTLMVELGKTIHFSLGFDNNVKITTPEDLALFKALLSMPEEELVKR